jgi:ABC-type Mn2+/Zn2+ transport system permease subunit
MTLWEPLMHPFMREALAVGILIGIVCAVFSCFLVLKGWSLMGDALSHAVLPGIVIAHAVGLPLAIGAFASGLLCAASMGWLQNSTRLRQDTVMGILFTGFFALGLVLFTKVETEAHLNHLLFGNILGIEPEDLWQTVILASAALFILWLKRRDLLLFCFDPGQARVIGLPVTALHYLMLTLLAATVVASVQAVGILLVVAMLITPGCTARLLTQRFEIMLQLAVLSAVSACVLGIFISFFANVATGPCIVLTQALWFALALLSRHLRQRRHLHLAKPASLC